MHEPEKDVKDETYILDEVETTADNVDDELDMVDKNNIDKFLNVVEDQKDPEEVETKDTGLITNIVVLQWRALSLA